MSGNQSVMLRPENAVDCNFETGCIKSVMRCLDQIVIIQYEIPFLMSE